MNPSEHREGDADVQPLSVSKRLHLVAWRLQLFLFS
jgi:hypothetical protein